MSAPKRPVDQWVDGLLDPSSGLSSNARLVAVAMSRIMRFSDLGNMYAGPSTLAKRTSLSLRAVRYAIAELRTAGWIVRTAQGSSAKGGERITSTYRGAYPPCTTCTGTEDRPVHQVHTTRAPDAPRPVHHVHTNRRDEPRTSYGGSSPDRAAPGRRKSAAGSSRSGSADVIDLATRKPWPASPPNGEDPT